MTDKEHRKKFKLVQGHHATKLRSCSRKLSVPDFEVQRFQLSAMANNIKITGKDGIWIRILKKWYE